MGNLLIIWWGFPCIWWVSFLFLFSKFSLCHWFLTSFYNVPWWSPLMFHQLEILWVSYIWCLFSRSGKYPLIISLNTLSFSSLYWASIISKLLSWRSKFEKVCNRPKKNKLPGSKEHFPLLNNWAQESNEYPFKSRILVIRIKKDELGNAFNSVWVCVCVCVCVLQWVQLL